MLTPDQLAEIEGRAACLYEYVDLPDEADVLSGTDVPALLAEVRQLTEDRDQARALIADLLEGRES